MILKNRNSQFPYRKKLEVQEIILDENGKAIEVISLLKDNSFCIRLSYWVSMSIFIMSVMALNKKPSYRPSGEIIEKMNLFLS